MTKETERPKFGVVVDWDDGLARIEPHGTEESAREEATKVALSGAEVFIVQVVDRVPGLCAPIKEAKTTQG